MFIPTIAAIATPPGRGGVGIIRVSGKKASEVALMMLEMSLPLVMRITRPFYLWNKRSLIKGSLFILRPHILLQVEDVLELHAHGGPVILDLLLKNILKLGIEMARPGEFLNVPF